MPDTGVWEALMQAQMKEQAPKGTARQRALYRYSQTGEVNPSDMYAMMKERDKDLEEKPSPLDDVRSYFSPQYGRR